MYEENNPAGVKAFMFEQEIIQNELRLPLVPVSEGLQKKIHSFVERF
jgi:4-hydroxy-tetrahydrodipicolinate synthase